MRPSPGHHAMAPPSSRLLRLGLALAMALALLGGAQPTAEAHAGCIPEATTNSTFQSLVSAINVFSSVFSTSAIGNCVDKFSDVEPVMERDYVADDAVAARGANARSNAPTSFARCKDGLAAGLFPCENIDMLAHVTMEELGSTFINDMWGLDRPGHQAGLRTGRGRRGHVLRRHHRPEAPSRAGHPADRVDPGWLLLA